jgi:hypothetical protein
MANRSSIIPKRRSTVVLLVLALSIIVLAFQQVYTFSVSQITTNNHGDSDWNARHQHSYRLEQPLPSSSKEVPLTRQHNIPLRNDNNSTFSACLLVMDDNHFLMEWLAYHYHTLPLRYLVIAVDPRSRTSPKLVLDRWENKDMTIVRWSDRHFLPKEWLGRMPAENDPIGKLMKHRERQRNFYPTCFELLKQAGREWTMVIDIDEFAMQNQHYFVNASSSQTTKKYPTTASTASSTTSSTTLLEAIQAQEEEQQPPHNTTCITMPRLRFGNYEDGNTTGKPLAPVGFRDQDFVTLRWRWRAELHSRKHNRNPKSMIHLQRISQHSTNFSRQDTDAHRPVRSECPQRNLYILNRASPFSVHHYVGSPEQFQFRRDARDGTKTRSDERLKGYGQVRAEIDESATGWLKELCDTVGYEQAKLWLEGVGNVSYTRMVTGK